MSGIFGKKQVLLGALVVALGIAVYLNYYYSVRSPSIDTDASAVVSQDHYGDTQFVDNPTVVNSGDLQAGTTEADPNDYFVQARKNRETARQEALDVIKDLMNDAKISQETQEQALEKAAAIASAVEQESKIESLVKAKGFEDCVAFIEGDKCSVVVRSAELKSAEALQITEIVTSQAGVKAENVNIVPQK